MHLIRGYFFITSNQIIKNRQIEKTFKLNIPINKKSNYLYCNNKNIYLI